MPAGFIIDLEFDSILSGPWENMAFPGRTAKTFWSNFELFHVWLGQYMKGPYLVKCSSTAHWAYNLLLSHPSDVVWVRTHCVNAKKITMSHTDDIKTPQCIIPIEKYDRQTSLIYEQIFFGSAADMTWIRNWLQTNPHPITSTNILHHLVKVEGHLHQGMKYRVESQLQKHGINLKLTDIGIDI